jgi:hypothetical protein
LQDNRVRSVGGEDNRNLKIIIFQKTNQETMAPPRSSRRRRDEDYHEDEHEQEYEKLVAPDDWDEGSVQTRHCTDCLCALLLVLCWLAATAIGLYAVGKGDYRLAIYPLDYDGNVCGTDFREDMTDYPYLLFVNAYTGGVCVKECPHLGGHTADNVSDIRTLVTYGGMWQPSSSNESELPLDFVEVAPYYVNSSDAIFCTDSLCYPDNSPVASWYAAGVNRGFGFAYYVGDTYEIFWRCYLTTEAQAQIQNKTQAETVLDIPDPKDILLTLSADVWQTKEYVLGFGFGVAFAVSFLYIFLMRMPLLLSFMVWLSVGLTIAAFGAAGFYSWTVAMKWDNTEPQRVADDWIRSLYAASVICFLIMLLLASLACCLRQQINMSIGCVKAAARAINRMPLILAVPVLQSIAFLITLGVFLAYGSHLASMGTINVWEFPIDFDSGAEIAVRTYDFDGTVEGMAWFLLFTLFWTSNFIVSVGDLIVAMSVSRWYFSKEKRRIGSSVVLGSTFNTLFYHVGTLAYGSLLIALVQLVRVLLERIRRAIKKANSKIANSVICCCQCCFCVLESCLKFINKNAYIQTAIFGTSFCQSARQAFNLIFRNAARVGAVSYVSASILIVGKLFIGAVTTSLSYYALLESDEDDKVNHIAGPLAVIFFISYMVSDMFMGVFTMSIKTILHCFVADEEMFDGEYADGNLVRWIDQYQQQVPVGTQRQK